MKQGNDGVSRKQAALGLVQILDIVAADRGGGNAQLTRALRERSSRIRTGQHNADQADVPSSPPRDLYGDAGLVGVQSYALGNQLGLRISWVVTQRERGVRRVGHQ